jgi:hypothetical protein
MSTEWEQIRTTEVQEKYDPIVRNILRDKADAWRHDYYKETSTGYDVHVAKSQQEVNRYKTAIKKYDASLKKITEALDAAEKPPTDPKVKALTQKELDELEVEYTEMYKLKCEQMVLLDGAEKTVQEWRWKQYVQKKRVELLQTIRNTFMVDGDAEYMARGVTWVEEYISTMRETMS